MITIDTEHKNGQIYKLGLISFHTYEYITLVYKFPKILDSTIFRRIIVKVLRYSQKRNTHFTTLTLVSIIFLSTSSEKTPGHTGVCRWSTANISPAGEYRTCHGASCPHLPVSAETSLLEVPLHQRLFCWRARG